MLSLFFPWGVLLQALALVHFIRRRPDTVWLWVIVFLGPLGALIYIVMEVAPDLGLLRQVFDSAGRRRRIAHLEALVLENPAAGNYEELADLHLDEGHYARARECYDKAISGSTDLDPIYRRGIASLCLGECDAAVRDLELVTTRDPRYRLQSRDWPARPCVRVRGARGAGRCVVPPGGRGLDAVGNLLQLTRRSWLRRDARPRRATGRAASSRANRSLPRYLQRRERPWYRKTAALLKRLAA